MPTTRSQARAQETQQTEDVCHTAPNSPTLKPREYTDYSRDELNSAAKSLITQLGRAQLPKSAAEFPVFIEELKDAIHAAPLMKFLLIYPGDSPHLTGAMIEAANRVGEKLGILLFDIMSQVSTTFTSYSALPGNYWAILQWLEDNQTLNWNPHYPLNEKIFKQRGPTTSISIHLMDIRRELLIQTGGLDIKHYPVLFGNIAWASHRKHYLAIQTKYADEYLAFRDQSNVTIEDVQAFIRKKFQHNAKDTSNSTEPAERPDSKGARPKDQSSKRHRRTHGNQSSTTPTPQIPSASNAEAKPRPNQAKST